MDAGEANGPIRTAERAPGRTFWHLLRCGRGDVRNGGVAEGQTRDGSAHVRRLQESSPQRQRQDGGCRGSGRGAFTGTESVLQGENVLTMGGGEGRTPT